MLKLSETWSTLEKVAEAAIDDAGRLAEERRRGEEMAREFKAHGYLRMTPTAALRESDLAFATFYEKVRPHERPSLGTAHWMLERDYAFVNVRACSPLPAHTGRVTDALKVIPTMRVSGIHLAPFFDCCMENLYAVDSVHMVGDDVLDPALTAAGVSGDAQIRMLLEGIHALGWKVGFDLEPHTSNFSRIALEHPRAFRWLRFNAARDGLWDGVDQETMLGAKWQKRLATEVDAIVAAALAEFAMTAMEDPQVPAARIRACHQAALHRLIDAGYWTLPSHTWGGAGLPKFDHYNHAENYPDYEYLNLEGEDHHEHAFGMLSPFRLYDGLPINAAPQEKPKRHAPGVKLLESIFPEVRKRYGFDFVRLDYVDHVFDAVVDDDPDFPVSDRMTPALLQDLLVCAGAPEVGAMAERMGVDVVEYGAIGFNLLLGSDVLTSMHGDYVDFLLKLQQKLDDPATEHAHCSTLAALDTHDSGHPLFWTVPLSQVVGADGIALRHFLARFATCGPRRRPKYEVMGNQDLSWGLYEANNKPLSLRWTDDVDFNARYHALEDVYEGLRETLAASRMGPHYVDPSGWAAWFLERAGSSERLLCVIACEPAIEKVGLWIEEPPEMAPVGPVRIDVNGAPVKELALDGSAPQPVTLDGGVLAIESLQPRACRLFVVG